jgi:hypothetical protein
MKQSELIKVIMDLTAAKSALDTQWGISMNSQGLDRAYHNSTISDINKKLQNAIWKLQELIPESEVKL